jgi:hypothetical protein
MVSSSPVPPFPASVAGYEAQPGAALMVVPRRSRDGGPARQQEEAGSQACLKTLFLTLRLQSKTSNKFLEITYGNVRAWVTGAS